MRKGIHWNGSWKLVQQDSKVALEEGLPSAADTM